MRLQFERPLVRPRPHEKPVCILVIHYGMMIGHEINERSEGQERENLRAKGQKGGRHAR
jgi:hypothetical protein